MADSRVTVLMPAYNAANFIKQAIESILRQSYPDFVFLIINDASTDETQSIILSYSDPRIRLVNNEKNSGVKESLNKGIALAETEFIARMDADDIADPDRLKWQLEYMDQHPEVGVSGGHFEFFGTEKGVVKMPLSNEMVKAKLFFLSAFCHPTVIMRTSVLRKSNASYGAPVIFDDGLGTRINEMEDVGMWHHLKHYTNFGNCDKVLLRYRKEGQNISAQKINDVSRRKVKVYRSLLHEIGITEATEKEVMFLFTLQHFKENKPIEDLTLYRAFLDKVIEANKKTKVYDAAAFEIAVNTIWEQFFFYLANLKLRYAFRYWKLTKGTFRRQAVYLLKFKLTLKKGA
jgi:glycosyltransferase involved in cell wall biosynthesis